MHSLGTQNGCLVLSTYPAAIPNDAMLRIHHPHAAHILRREPMLFAQRQNAFDPANVARPAGHGL